MIIQIIKLQEEFVITVKCHRAIVAVDMTSDDSSFFYGVAVYEVRAAGRLPGQQTAPYVRVGIHAAQKLSGRNERRRERKWIEVAR